MSPRPDGAGWTLAQLREFHEAQAWQLEADEKRRGAWPGETERREAFEATVRLIERISSDAVVVARLKARGT